MGIKHDEETNSTAFDNEWGVLIKENTTIQYVKNTNGFDHGNQFNQQETF